MTEVERTTENVNEAIFNMIDLILFCRSSNNCTISETGETVIDAANIAQVLSQVLSYA